MTLADTFIDNEEAWRLQIDLTLNIDALIHKMCQVPITRLLGRKHLNVCNFGNKEHVGYMFCSFIKESRLIRL